MTYEAKMARFSFKLLVLIVATLAFAAFLSWSRDFGNPYAHLQQPLRGKIAEEKRETHIDNESTESQNIEAENFQGNPKIALKTEESQEDSNQRTDKEGNEAPQVNKISDDNDLQEKQDDQEDLQGNNNGNTQDDGERIKTFFTALPTSFAALRLEDGNGIPTKAFLDACTDLTPFLNKFGKTSMNLAHNDLSGNARKIHAVYEIDTEVSWTLQKMVLHEFENGDYEVDGKGTISLLWLKRGFEFVAEFLQRLADGEETNVAANKAYDNSLGHHHNFILRGTFKLAFTTLAYRHDFFKTLAVNLEDTTIANFDEIVAEDMAQYNKGLQYILQLLRDFFTEKGLEN
ncbi:uncharacterized protein [Amphiura filiformis]|uniref:uncharacterized protein n=1 Tax=Amphiura filiformis TaxID=82378 RepID=UPI003B225EF0